MNQVERSERYFRIKRSLDIEQNIVDNFFRVYYNDVDEYDEDLHIISPWRDWVTNYGKSKISKSWLKMYEILNLPASQEFISQKDSFRSFHNCEFPGAFMFSTYYNLKSQGKEINWALSSYYPQNSNDLQIYDAYDLMEQFPDKILVGPINTSKGLLWNDGDMSQMGSIKMTLLMLNTKLGPGGVDIYTSDAGMGVKRNEDYNLEEKTLAIKYGEVLTGLKCLKEGGMLMIKFYDLETALTYSLICLMAERFDKFRLIKPEASLPVNTENFFVGWGYKKNEALIEVLTKNFNTSSDTDLLNLVPVKTEVVQFLESEYCNILEKKVSDLKLYLSGQLKAGTYELPTIDSTYILKLNKNK